LQKQGQARLKRVANEMDKEHKFIEREINELKKRFSYKEK
jgi:hypothetical protein